MGNYFRLLLLAAIIAGLCPSIPAGGKTSVPSYTVGIRIEPASSRMECRAVVKHAPASVFYLHKNLEVRRVLVNGKEAAFHRDPSLKPLPFSVGTAVVVEASSPGEMSVEYAGSLTEVINGVNMINADMVELALYSAWYPLFKDTEFLDFKLEADLPAGFRTVTNGIQESERQSSGRTVSRWSSLKPGSDIVLLASPHLQKAEANRNGISVEFYYQKMPPAQVEIKKDNMVKGMNRLSGLYGAPRVKGMLRMVCSPRKGWGYSRMPLFVVSEQYAMGQLEKEDGRAMDFHGMAHELAHFWWMIADTSTPDDWINEGLAEYSAFRLSREQFGEAFAQQLVSEYRKHASESRTGSAIAETEASSEDRYVNRYEKTTLLFLEAEHRFGQQKLDLLIRSLYSRFAGTRNATTKLFLAEVEKQMGSEARSYFSEGLLRKGEEKAHLPQKG